MKNLISDDRRIICDNPDSLFRYFGWPSVARLPDGTLAMACSGFRLKHICPFGKAVICYSRDEGKTWTRPAPVIDTILDDRDAGIIPLGGNRVMVTSFNNSFAQQHGWNQLRTGRHVWQDETWRTFAEAYVNLGEADGREAEFLGSVYKISEDGGYTFGKLRHVPVTSPHGPCVLRDGTVLYVGTAIRYDGNGDHLRVYKLNAEDEFEYVSSIPDIPDGKGGVYTSCEPHAIGLPSGKILVHIRVQGATFDESVYTTYQSESYDGGKTFTKPHPLLSERGGAPAHLVLHSSGVLVSVYSYREAPTGNRAMFSRDGGETWDIDYAVGEQGLSEDLGYPASVELSDGRMLTVYYEKISDQSVIMQQIWEMPR